MRIVAWCAALVFCSWQCHADPLRVVLEVSPPHQTYDKQVVGGLTTNVVRELLQHADLSGAFEVYPWARAFNIAKSTPNVLIYNMARTPEREADFIWIGPVARYKFGFVKLKSRHDIQLQQVEDAKKFVVGTQREDFTAEWLAAKGFADTGSLQLQPDIMETWRMLVHGKIDLLIDDPHAIDDMLLRFHLRSDEIEFSLFIPELAQTTWIALAKNSDTELVQRLQQAYQKVVQGEAYRLVMAYPDTPLASK